MENEIRKTEISKMFVGIDTSDFSDFYSYKKPLKRAMWALWVAKEKLEIKKLTAEQIALIIREVKEVGIDAKSIAKSFNRAGDKIYTYHEKGEVYYEIMKSGKDHLISQVKKGSIEVFYFGPDKRYTSKRILSKNVLNNLKGELRIVDPYCGKRTLDILEGIKNEHVKFLTRIKQSNTL